MTKEMEDNLEWLILCYAQVEGLDAEWWANFRRVERIKIVMDKLLFERKIEIIEDGIYTLYQFCSFEEED